ncbi:MAG: hypothetical protein ACP5RH_13990 [Leptodesmis sp.]|uniref:hypothetical protein n=1 Tax=Leptodesmis sp. TaxID=3100501 RepID=UPI003D11E385
MSSNYRLILYHKHPSSGRTLFLRLHETVCQFDGLSTASRVVESYLAEHAGKFIALTEARRLLPTELELLRLAYSIIMDD